MRQINEIHAVELVRQIRDEQAKQLAKKSTAEVIEFFNRAAERAKKRRVTRRFSRPRFAR